MRLDKFLKVSRLIKRRTVANSICESARVFVNDNPAKPAKVIKEGDIITIEFKDSIKRVMKYCKTFNLFLKTLYLPQF